MGLTRHGRCNGVLFLASTAAKSKGLESTGFVFAHLQQEASRKAGLSCMSALVLLLKTLVVRTWGGPLSLLSRGEGLPDWPQPQYGTASEA